LTVEKRVQAETLQAGPISSLTLAAAATAAISTARTRGGRWAQDRAFESILPARPCRAGIGSWQLPRCVLSELRGIYVVHNLIRQSVVAIIQRRKHPNLCAISECTARLPWPRVEAIKPFPSKSTWPVHRQCGAIGPGAAGLYHSNYHIQVRRVFWTGARPCRRRSEAHSQRSARPKST